MFMRFFVSDFGSCGSCDVVELDPCVRDYDVHNLLLHEMVPQLLEHVIPQLLEPLSSKDVIPEHCLLPLALSPRHRYHYPRHCRPLDLSRRLSLCLTLRQAFRRKDRRLDLPVRIHFRRCLRKWTMSLMLMVLTENLLLFLSCHLSLPRTHDMFSTFLAPRLLDLSAPRDCWGRWTYASSACFCPIETAWH